MTHKAPRPPKGYKMFSKPGVVRQTPLNAPLDERQVLWWFREQGKWLSTHTRIAFVPDGFYCCLNAVDIFSSKKSSPADMPEIIAMFPTCEELAGKKTQSKAMGRYLAAKAALMQFAKEAK